jgi:bacillithiol synthase
MEIRDLALPSSNKLATDYLFQKKETDHFFDYQWHHPEVFHMRHKDLLDRKYPRKELVKYLLSYHQRFRPSDKTIENIQKLENPESVVVIGGQQAGLLTGPLYTIHKIISIIQLAKQQEQILNVPVLPVFWIAGEDHDFAEINHVFVQMNDQVVKKTIPQQEFKKRMVSNIPIDRDSCWKWLQEVVETYGETKITNDLLGKFKQWLYNSTTFVDFFASIILELFGQEGLIVVDSASPPLRKIESTFFKELILRNEVLSHAVLTQQKRLTECGYVPIIEISEENTHLFVEVDGERVLLERKGQQFIGKNFECQYNLEELLDIAEKVPEKLSNNVVSRPLMQEYLFPTLAFIAGPGEIAYWAELQKAFSVFGWKVPPVVPRLMMTFLERSIETDLQEVNLTLDDAMLNRIDEAKRGWFQSQQPFPVEEVMDEAKFKIEEIHKNIRRLGVQISPHLRPVLEKNAQFIQSQLDFIQRVMERELYQQHETVLKKFDRIQNALIPKGVPQERIWNIFYFINRYGFDFVEKLLDLPFEFNGKHKIIFL